jgi:hypothetical protein
MTKDVKTYSSTKPKKKDQTNSHPQQFCSRRKHQQRAIFGIIEMNYNGDDETEEEDTDSLQHRVRAACRR